MMRSAIGVIALVAASTDALFAQENKLTIASLRRPMATWSEAEVEFGMARWDSIFPSRVVRRGTRVRPLPAGSPLPALAAGTDGGRSLERFITEQKVAGMIILHDGKIRFERYALGHSPTGRWMSQSVAKSIASTLVGAAVKDGYITSIDDPVATYVAGLRGSAYDSVTIRQLLTMTSGVRWREDYTDTTSDITQFYRQPIEAGQSLTVSYMRRLPSEAPPGKKWLYKTGETHLIGVLVQEATKKGLAAYLSEKIWAPYGMELDAAWQVDATGYELAGCCLMSGLRDYARFGQFILDGARIDGRSIVPDGWLAAATTKQVATDRPGRGYGYQWWTWDTGGFAAIGIYGQLVHIDPSRRLVVAISSAWPVATGQAQSDARSAILLRIAAAVDAEKTSVRAPHSSRSSTNSFVRR
jgi:CubicO group peptidase (beta-lactamase class C family)